MLTSHQMLGDKAEKAVCKNIVCLKCKIGKMRQLVKNFQSADVICDFCGFLAQVKGHSLKSAGQGLPQLLLGASWGPQKAKIAAGIYHPLFVVTFVKGSLEKIYYVPPEIQVPGFFVPRNPLGPQAHRAGWTGFMYDLTKLPPGTPILVHTFPAQSTKRVGSQPAPPAVSGGLDQYTAKPKP